MLKKRNDQFLSNLIFYFQSHPIAFHINKYNLYNFLFFFRTHAVRGPYRVSRRIKGIAMSQLQVTSHPVQRNFARLKITEAYTIIPGAPDLHVKQGSSLRLECQLMAATEKPLYVFWYRQGRMINYDEEPGVDVKLTPSGSVLTVNKTKLTHDGNYTCEPNNAKAASVMVHVIEGERETRWLIVLA